MEVDSPETAEINKTTLKSAHKKQKFKNDVDEQTKDSSIALKSIYNYRDEEGNLVKHTPGQRSVKFSTKPVEIGLAAPRTFSRNYLQSNKKKRKNVPNEGFFMLMNNPEVLKRLDSVNNSNKANTVEQDGENKKGPVVNSHEQIKINYFKPPMAGNFVPSSTKADGSDGESNSDDSSEENVYVVGQSERDEEVLNILSNGLDEDNDEAFFNTPIKETDIDAEIRSHRLSQVIEEAHEPPPKPFKETSLCESFNLNSDKEDSSGGSVDSGIHEAGADSPIEEFGRKPPTVEVKPTEPPESPAETKRSDESDSTSEVSETSSLESDDQDLPSPSTDTMTYLQYNEEPMIPKYKRETKTSSESPQMSPKTQNAFTTEPRKDMFLRDGDYIPEREPYSTISPEPVIQKVSLENYFSDDRNQEGDYIKKEKERERLRELKRQQEIEEQRLLAIRKQQEIEQQRLQEIQRQQEHHKQIELHKAQELQRQIELERLQEAVKQEEIKKQELQKQQELMRQRELQHQKEMEKQQEIMRQLEAKHKEELQRQERLEALRQKELLERRRVEEEMVRKQLEMQRQKDEERRHLELLDQIEREKERKRQPIFPPTKVEAFVPDDTDSVIHEIDDIDNLLMGLVQSDPLIHKQQQQKRLKQLEAQRRWERDQEDERRRMQQESEERRLQEEQHRLNEERLSQEFRAKEEEEKRKKADLEAIRERKRRMREMTLDEVLKLQKTKKSSSPTLSMRSDSISGTLPSNAKRSSNESLNSFTNSTVSDKGTLSSVWGNEMIAPMSLLHEIINPYVAVNEDQGNHEELPSTSTEPPHGGIPTIVDGKLVPSPTLTRSGASPHHYGRTSSPSPGNRLGPDSPASSPSYYLQNSSNSPSNSLTRRITTAGSPKIPPRSPIPPSSPGQAAFTSAKPEPDVVDGQIYPEKPKVYNLKPAMSTDNPDNHPSDKLSPNTIKEKHKEQWLDIDDILADVESLIGKPQPIKTAPVNSAVKNPPPLPPKPLPPPALPPRGRSNGTPPLSPQNTLTSNPLDVSTSPVLPPRGSPNTNTAFTFTRGLNPYESIRRRTSVEDLNKRTQELSLQRNQPGTSASYRPSVVPPYYRPPETNVDVPYYQPQRMYQRNPSPFYAPPHPPQPRVPYYTPQHAPLNNTFPRFQPPAAPDHSDPNKVQNSHHHTVV